MPTYYNELATAEDNQASFELGMAPNQVVHKLNQICLEPYESLHSALEKVNPMVIENEKGCYLTPSDTAQVFALIAQMAQA